MMTSPNSRRLRKQRATMQARVPRDVLIIDTETTTDETQRLLFGCWRYLRRNQTDRTDSWECVAEGLIYADDLLDRDPAAYAALRDYAASRSADVDMAAEVSSEPDWRMPLLSRSEFMDRWWYGLAVPHKQRMPAGLVFFNAPFDISRLAVGVAEARGDMAGGFSYTMWTNRDGSENRYRPRIAVKNIDSKRSLIKYRATGDTTDVANAPQSGARTAGGRQRVAHFNGHFIDLRTAVFALTGKSTTLDSACRLYGVEGKTVPVLGVVNDEAIQYCRDDVAATARLFEAVVNDFESHPVDLQLTKAYSPASIAKTYLDAMGLVPPLAPGGSASAMDPAVHGAAMSAFYGGRAECHIRRAPVPVRLVDFTSMYPSVNALMGTWRLLTAAQIDSVESTPERLNEDQTFLQEMTVEALIDQDTWPSLLAIAQVVPDGDLLPIRAAYRDGDWSIGLNHLHARTSDEAHWYTLADLAASTLLTGTAPRLLRVIRFEPRGLSAELRPVALRGAALIDPAEGDFFTSVIEERQRRRQIDEDDPVAAFLKVLANSGSYGIYAEMTRQSAAEYLTVYNGSHRPTAPPGKRLYEEPGRFTLPAVGACITGAARLMLALLEHLVAQVGGSWAFCDTDSMAIVATPYGGEEIELPGGPVAALSYAQIDAIRTTLNRLNPYNRDLIPQLLKVEKNGTGDCYAISAKRYAIYLRRDDMTIKILKRSEHGLGQYLNPINPHDVDDEGKPLRDRDELGATWITQAWKWIIRTALDPSGAEHSESGLPRWADQTACSRLTISSPALLRPFNARNASRPWADQIKPANFMLVATLAPFGSPIGEGPDSFRLVTPYARHTAGPLVWTNLHDPSGAAVPTASSVENASADAAIITTYRSVLHAYAIHPEHKFDAPERGPCRTSTRGLLQRSHVTASNWVTVGKEANRLADVAHGVVTPAEVTTVYDDGTAFRLSSVVLPSLESLSGREIARRTGLDATTVNRIRRGTIVPHHGTIQALECLAREVGATR